MTETMWALVAQGGRTLNDTDAFALERRPVPELRPRDVLVRVHAVSVNPVDTKSRNRIHSGTGRILGWDASGTVEAVGSDVRSIQVGEDVYYAGDISRDGSDAELQAVDERIVGRKPTSLTHAEAAALPLTTITAWETLFDRFGLQKESTGTLLVLGGAGGVGSIMIQLAKQLTAVRVIATASRGESRAWAERMGADEVVDHHDLAANVLAAAPDGVDWVFSPHSRGNIAAFAKILKPFGAVTAIDEPSNLDLVPLKSKSIAWHWELMFTKALFETHDIAGQGALLDETARLIDAGILHTTATQIIAGLTPESLRQAHAAVDSGRAIGKVVVHD